MWLLALAAFASDLTPAQESARKRLRGAVVSAWEYRGPAESTPPAGRKYVGADLVFDRFTSAIELTAIEVFDPESGEAAGNPQFACLGPTDMKVHCGGPGEQAIRVRAVWSVPVEARELRFSLWEKKLGKAEIGPIGPTLPRLEIRDAARELGREQDRGFQ